MLYDCALLGVLSDATAGLDTGSHFVGVCDGCRPSEGLQEVGLLNDGEPITYDADGSVSHGKYWDTEISLTGVNSIIGRSIVLHRADGNRIGQCVVGIVAEHHAHMPEITAASCSLQETVSNTGTVSGSIDFVKNDDVVEVQYHNISPCCERVMCT
jgi:hypothetical protein